MYHIKEDKRAKKSAELIYEALCHCLAHKSFESITISDIERVSHVSRSTFYRHFDQLSDILYWRCDLYFQEVWMQYQPPISLNNHNHNHFVEYFLNYWFKNNEILEILLNIHRTDIIYACHMDHLPIFLNKCRDFVFVCAEDMRYFVGIRTGIMIGILMTWIQGGKKESVHELIHILDKQIAILQNDRLFI